MDYSYSSMGPRPYLSGFPHPQGHTAGQGQLEDFQLNSDSAPPFDPAFVPFQQNFHYDPSTFLAQPHQLPSQTQGSSSPELSRHDSTASAANVDMVKTQPSVNEVAFDEIGVASTIRSSSEEKDMVTPQQSRRKAQNRAAQRAFRERKEKHVKDLEAQLTSLQHQSASLNGENERLRCEIAKITTENKILRATSASSSGASARVGASPDELVGPWTYTPVDPPPASGNAMTCTTVTDADARLGHAMPLKSLTVDDETGERLLAAGPTWDYIKAHELVKKGLVDIGDVSERLKKLAKCSGHGPVFKESDIRRAISESAVAGGQDELI